MIEEEDDGIFFIVEDNIMCNLCNKKVYALDWLDQETVDSWDAQTTMEHVIYWINQHFKEEHKNELKRRSEA